MKRLAAAALAVALLAGVTACKPSEEEVAKQAECAKQYIRDNGKSFKTDEDLAALNKELETACKTNPGFLRRP